MKTCGQVMAKNPACCVASQTADDVVRLMRARDVGSIPVVDDFQSRKLVGIVTDRDVALKVILRLRHLAATRVSGIMTRQIVTCRDDDDVSTALDIMTTHGVWLLPVVDHHERGIARVASPERIERIAPRCSVPFRPRKKKVRQAKFHRCSRCGAQVRRRSARCKKCAEVQKR